MSFQKVFQERFCQASNIESVRRVFDSPNRISNGKTHTSNWTICSARPCCHCIKSTDCECNFRFVIKLNEKNAGCVCRQPSITVCRSAIAHTKLFIFGRFYWWDACYEQMHYVCVLFNLGKINMNWTVECKTMIWGKKKRHFCNIKRL